MYDITIAVPAIRTYLWKKFYDSIKESCKRYTYEVLFVGPFELPEELRGISNVRHVKTYMHHTAAVQLSLINAAGTLWHSAVDDSVFLPGALDAALDFYCANCGKKDVVSALYLENNEKRIAGAEYAWYWGDLQLPGIERHWKTAVQPIANTSYLTELGGLDCQFEYLDKAIHDLMFRLQKDGGQIHLSPTEISSATWYREDTGDHGPIHYGAQKDIPIFNTIYSVRSNRLFININNWKEYPPVWGRRFDKLYKTYEELVEGRNYKI